MATATQNPDIGYGVGEAVVDELRQRVATDEDRHPGHDLATLTGVGAEREHGEEHRKEHAKRIPHPGPKVGHDRHSHRPDHGCEHGHSGAWRRQANGRVAERDNHAQRHHSERG